MSHTGHSGRRPDEEGGCDLLVRSALYQEYLAERAEILKHKWCESQKVGRDIGIEAAVASWTMRHRLRWREAWRGRR